MYLPKLSAQTGGDPRSIFKRSLTGLKWEFSFSLTSCQTKPQEPSLPYYSFLGGGITDWFIPLSRTLPWSEIQTASFMIWTPVSGSISCKDNYYATYASRQDICIYILLFTAILLTNSAWKVGQTGFFTFGKATDLGEGTWCLQ